MRPENFKQLSKVDAQVALQRLGVKVPPSVDLTTGTQRQILDFFDRHPHIVYWHLRDVGTAKVERRQAQIFHREVLASELQKNKRLGYGLLTAHIECETSGVLYVGRNWFLVEYVPGALVSLLREGVTPSRYLAEVGRSPVHVRVDASEWSYRWNGPRLIREESMSPGRLSPRTEALFHKLCESSESFTAYEWLEDSAQTVYFIDMKHSVPSFLVGLKALAFGLDSQNLFTLPQPITGRTSHSLTATRGKVLVYERAKYELLPKVESITGLILRDGGVLSHLAFYSAIRGVPGVVSPSLYTKFATSNQQIQILPPT